MAMKPKHGTWPAKIDRARKVFAEWVKLGEKAQRRYQNKPEQGDVDLTGKSRYNALWANVQALQPALFSRAPTVVAERRHRDRDPIGRIAAEVITRGANQEVERNNLEEAMSQVVLDNLLVARGVPWVRYEADKLDPRKVVMHEGTPQIAETGEPVDPTAVAKGKDGLHVDETRFDNQRTAIDHVEFRDFVHSEARTWADVERNGWVGRRVTMSRKEGVERFGEKFRHVDLTLPGPGSRKPLSEGGGVEGEATHAEVWEIWDKPSRKQIFVATGVKGNEGEGVLEVRDDPYHLEKFFPCPKPAYGTLTNEDLIPIPDYEQYRDQAEELDRISSRIRRLTSALKNVGAYDGSAEKLATLLEADDGTMVPIPGLKEIQGSGKGADDAVWFMPMRDIAQTLMHLYEARNQAKAVLDQISGVADLVRGQVDPREKAAQSKIKASFVSQRLDQRRKAVEKCARDTIRIVVELQIEMFPKERLREQSGYDLIDEVRELREDYEQQLQQLQEQAAEDPSVVQSGQEPPNPVEGLWDAVVQMLENDKVRGFRIDVESDSTIEMDQTRRKEERTEFLEAMGGFLNNALPIMEASPDLAEPVAAMLEYAAKGYNAGRGLEGVFEEASRKIRERAEMATQQEQQAAEQGGEQPPPDPKAEAEAARIEQQTEIEGQRAQAEQQQATVKMQAAQQEGQIKLQTAQVKLREAQVGLEKAQIDLAIRQEELRIKKETVAPAPPVAPTAPAPGPAGAGM